MNALVKYGLIGAAVIGFMIYNNFSNDGLDYIEDEIDLNAVLDVTVESLYAFNESLEGVDTETLDPDNTFVEFSEILQADYNAAQPALYKNPIAVAPRNDASLLAYADTNQDNELQDNEDALFLIEIDGENARIVATSRSGAVNDHRFSGTGLLAGYLIGSMLNRQRMSGVDTKNLASKQTMTAKQAARSRAGSGSHSKGK